MQNERWGIMELLDEQLNCSLYGNFEQGFEIAKELEKQTFKTKGQFYIDTARSR